MGPTPAAESEAGGVFAFGAARYAGGATGEPVTGLAATPTGGGYWLAGGDGGARVRGVRGQGDACCARELDDRTLGEPRLRDEGILVLGIVRSDGSYFGVPTKATRIEAGETVILYGRDGRFAELTARPRGPAGNQAHGRAVTAQAEMAEEEDVAG